MKRKRSMVYRISILLFCLLPLNTIAQNAETPGISFYVLRVIYSENSRGGASLTAYNKTPNTYLLQSRILPVHPDSGNVDLDSADQNVMPFIVTPPLARLEEYSDLTLRIRRNGVPLPADRESVFYISMKAIPSEQTVIGDRGKVVLTVTSNIKVFYRPDGLESRAVEDAAKQIRFERSGQILTARNPTPYWLTFSRLSVGTQQLSQDQLRLMVPPKGQRDYNLPRPVEGELSWQLIDEDGWDTPEMQDNF